MYAFLMINNLQTKSGRGQKELYQLQFWHECHEKCVKIAVNKPPHNLKQKLSIVSIFKLCTLLKHHFILIYLTELEKWFQ